jgi:hypothetical protein
MITIATQTALSVAANATTADQVSGTYQFVGKGVLSLIAKSSATGMKVSCVAGGVALVSNQFIPYTGTAGTISVKDNVMFSQKINGGRIELYLTNTTGGALTNDYLLLFEPM